MKKVLFSVLVISLIFILSACFFVGDSTVTVSPVIRAIGLPANITSVELTVSGPGMNTIVVVYDDLPSSIELSVPTGSDRTFELVVYVNTPIIAATSYKGTATVDLSQGDAEVALSMGVNSTKLVIPDAYSYRIVQIDNMSDKGWTIATGTNLGFSTNINFFPYDIDIDQYGQIYIANNNTNEYAGIIRINSIIDTNPVLILSNTASPTAMTCVSIDKKNNRIYGLADNNNVYWTDYTGSTTLGNLFFTPTTETITGIAIDNDGNVYLSGRIGTVSQNAWVGKYSSAQVQLATYTGLVGETAYDITFLDGEIYATKSGGGVPIEKFDPQLNFLDSYGTTGTGGGTGEFYQPFNFVAIMNKKVTVIDVIDSGSYAQLVSFDDITGSNWDVYGTYGNIGDGVGFFRFFSWC